MKDLCFHTGDKLIVSSDARSTLHTVPGSTSQIKFHYEKTLFYAAIFLAYSFKLVV